MGELLMFKEARQTPVNTALQRDVRDHTVQEHSPCNESGKVSRQKGLLQLQRITADPREGGESDFQSYYTIIVKCPVFKNSKII